MCFSLSVNKNPGFHPEYKVILQELSAERNLKYSQHTLYGKNTGVSPSRLV